MSAWSLAYNLSNLSGPTINMKVPVGIARKIIETQGPMTIKPLTTGEKIHYGNHMSLVTLRNDNLDIEVYLLNKNIIQL